MAVPRQLRDTMSPPELELIASQQLIEIIPLISMEKTAFISGSYGPLRPPHKAQVPLWIAINLKQKKKCHIVAPPWLNVEYLQAQLAEETKKIEYSDLPFHFPVISKLLLDIAQDDIENPDKIRSLLKDLREVRQAKAREGLKKLDHSEISLSRISSMELNEIRPFFARSMSILLQLKRDPLAQQDDFQ